MDLQEWELLGDDDQEEEGERFLQVSKIYPTNILHVNYFICPPPPMSTLDQLAAAVPPNHALLPVPIQLQPPPEIDVNVPSPAASEAVKSPDPDPCVTQVFFKKMIKETEFVDTISSNSNCTKPKEIINIKNKIGDLQSTDTESESESDEGGLNNFNILKWSLSGVGAICTFGVAAAATVCVIVLNKNTQRHHKIGIQISTNDHHRMKGVRHLQHARITFGGYCHPHPHASSL